jgi:hypothetical protein
VYRFVQVNEMLIGRRPESHVVLDDGLIVNDYSLSRPESSTSVHSSTKSNRRSRSVSPARNKHVGFADVRQRSPSPARRALSTSQSFDVERRSRTPSPYQTSNSLSTKQADGHSDDFSHDNGK